MITLFFAVVVPVAVLTTAAGIAIWDWQRTRGLCPVCGRRIGRAEPRVVRVRVAGWTVPRRAHWACMDPTRTIVRILTDTYGPGKT